MGYHKRIDSEKLNAMKTRFDSNLVYQEHVARYNFVKKFVRGKIVLDLGCGIGDGTYELSKYAKKLVGVELDRARLKCAFDNFIKTNISYLAMDGCFLAFADNIFDVVVSLEVIEHLEKQDKFLSEIMRILNDGGIAIISTPNKEIVRAEGTRPSSSHIKELTFKEFKVILNKHFSAIELFGQKRGRRIKGISGFAHYVIRFIDVFNMRKFFSQSLRNNLFDWIAKSTGAKDTNAITTQDLIISRKKLAYARNIIAVCEKRKIE